MSKEYFIVHLFCKDEPAYKPTDVLFDIEGYTEPDIMRCLATKLKNFIAFHTGKELNYDGFTVEYDDSGESLLIENYIRWEHAITISVTRFAKIQRVELISSFDFDPRDISLLKNYLKDTWIVYKLYGYGQSGVPRYIDRQKNVSLENAVLNDIRSFMDISDIHIERGKPFSYLEGYGFTGIIKEIE